MTIKPSNPRIVIVDLGSQFTLLIERTLRERGYRSAVLTPERAAQWVRAKGDTKAIILSGGQHSVYEKHAPTVGEELIECGIPILGICYGMQLLAHMSGGEVRSAEQKRAYVPTSVIPDTVSRLFANVGEKFQVIMSHGDTVETLPSGFKSIANPEGDQSCAAMEKSDANMFGVQFHPECKESESGGMMLENFVAGIAGCQKDWDPSNLIDEIKLEIASSVTDCLAVLGFSGGVDSTTLLSIAGSALGGKLKAVCVDCGQLRQGEIEWIREYAERRGINLETIDARKKFAATWENLPEPADPELKRKLFRKVYAECLSGVIERFGASCLIQGTLAPDLIESGQTGGACIKTHHNTGIDIPGCSIVNPFGGLFKYEVRALAAELDLPEEVVKKQPFPGPGLLIRIIGGWPTEERLNVVRWADVEVTRILKKHGLYEDLSQLVVAIPAVKVVGVKGDQRVHGYMPVVRGVKTVDFMTAIGYEFPTEVRREIIAALTKHQSIVGVLWDETPKPPRTVEFE